MCLAPVAQGAVSPAPRQPSVRRPAGSGCRGLIIARMALTREEQGSRRMGSPSGVMRDPGQATLCHHGEGNRTRSPVGDDMAHSAIAECPWVCYKVHV